MAQACVEMLIFWDKLCSSHNCITGNTPAQSLRIAGLLAVLTGQFHGAGVQTCTPTMGQKGGVTEDHGLKDLVDGEGEGEAGGGGQGSEVREP